MKLLIVDDDGSWGWQLKNWNEEGIFGNCNCEIVVEKLERGEDIWKL